MWLSHDDAYIGWKRWRAPDFGCYGPEQGAYFAGELRASGIRSVVGLTIGEIGYGNGEFAGWVQQAGGFWMGRELSAELRHRAVMAGYEIICADEDFCSANGAIFDVIVAFDVIEHLSIEAIRLLLSDAKAALKIGGLLIIRCPSGDSPFSGATYYGDLTHRTLIGSSAATQLAMETGLSVHQVRAPVLPIWGLGTTRAVRRMTVRLMQTLAFSFIRHVIIGDKNAVLSPNMIVVFRKVEETT